MAWDLVVNLAAAFIGYLIARGVAYLRRRRRTSAGRRFWRAFPERVVVVLPVWDRTVQGWTSSGILGPGDVRGLMRLQRGMIELDRRCDVIEASSLVDGSGDLVFLGGPKANVWTATALGRYEAARRFAFEEDGALRDTATGGTYGGMRTDAQQQDAGLVMRAPNPLGSGTVLILAGVTGVGTDAAARLVSADVGLLNERIPEVGHEAVEIVFTVDVVNGQPQTPRIEAVHELSSLSGDRASM